MIDISRRFGENNRLGRIVTVLDSHAGEQIRHLVVPLLGPFLQRMIVASGARETLTQECLCDVLRQLDSVLVQDEVVQSAILPCAAAAGEDVASKLIPRFVLLNTVANPVIKRACRRRPKLLAGN